MSVISPSGVNGSSSLVAHTGCVCVCVSQHVFPIWFHPVPQHWLHADLFFLFFLLLSFHFIVFFFLSQPKYIFFSPWLSLFFSVSSLSLCLCLLPSLCPSTAVIIVAQHLDLELVSRWAGRRDVIASAFPQPDTTEMPSSPVGLSRPSASRVAKDNRHTTPSKTILKAHLPPLVESVNGDEITHFRARLSFTSDASSLIFSMYLWQSAFVFSFSFCLFKIWALVARGFLKQVSRIGNKWDYLTLLAELCFACLKKKNKQIWRELLLQFTQIWCFVNSSSCSSCQMRWKTSKGPKACSWSVSVLWDCSLHCAVYKDFFICFLLFKHLWQGK